MAVNKKITAFAFSNFLFLGLNLSMLQRLVGEIGAKYSLSNTSVGTIITMVFVGYFISPILTGELTDKVGRKKVLLFTFSAQLAGFLIALLINSPIAIGAGFFVIGMSFSTLELSLSSLLTDISKSSATGILNLSRFFFALGTVTGPFLAILLLSLAGDWVYVMLASLIMAAILFAVFLKFSFPVPRYPIKNIETHDETGITIKLLKKRLVIILGLGIMAYVALEAGITFYVSSYISTITSDEMYSTLTLSVFWFCVATGRMVFTRYKGSSHILVTLLSLLAAAGLGICLSFGGLAVSIVSFGVMGLGCSAILPTILAMGKDNFPKYTNTIFGILLTAAGLGGILQPIIMGAVADAADLKAALAVCLAPLAIILATQVVLIILAKKAKKNRPAKSGL